MSIRKKRVLQKYSLSFDEKLTHGVIDRYAIDDEVLPFACSRGILSGVGALPFSR